MIGIGLLAATVGSACVERSEAIRRGMTWVNSQIPYSQQKQKQGYRTDCSGFVSMSWGLGKPGITTRNFVPSVCTQTTKENLAKGDLILNPGNHVAIFLEWANAQKTEHWILEENGEDGAVKRKTAYPYGRRTGYFPCKVKLACDAKHLTSFKASSELHVKKSGMVGRLHLRRKY